MVYITNGNWSYGLHSIAWWNTFIPISSLNKENAEPLVTASLLGGKNCNPFFYQFCMRNFDILNIQIQIETLSRWKIGVTTKSWWYFWHFNSWGFVSEGTWKNISNKIIFSVLKGVFLFLGKFFFQKNLLLAGHL